MSYLERKKKKKQPIHSMHSMNQQYLPYHRYGSGLKIMVNLYNQEHKEYLSNRQFNANSDPICQNDNRYIYKIKRGKSRDCLKSYIENTKDKPERLHKKAINQNKNLSQLQCGICNMNQIPMKGRTNLSAFVTRRPDSDAPRRKNVNELYNKSTNVGKYITNSLGLQKAKSVAQNRKHKNDKFKPKDRSDILYEEPFSCGQIEINKIDLNNLKERTFYKEKKKLFPDLEKQYETLIEKSLINNFPSFVG